MISKKYIKSNKTHKNKRPNKALEKTLPPQVYYEKFSPIEHTNTIPDDDIIFIDIPLSKPKYIDNKFV